MQQNKQNRNSNKLALWLQIVQTVVSVIAALSGIAAAVIWTTDGVSTWTNSKIDARINDIPSQL